MPSGRAPKTTQRKRIVFISFSHHDEKLKNRLVKHLSVLQGQEILEVWADGNISAGSDWFAEICRAIDLAAVAVLLISVDFLNSEFIRHEEVPRLLYRGDSEGLRVFPILVGDCCWEEVPWLARLNMRPRDRRPLGARRGNGIDAELAAIAGEILRILRGTCEPRSVLPKSVRLKRAKSRRGRHTNPAG